jgi:hypothetical protein
MNIQKRLLFCLALIGTAMPLFVSATENAFVSDQVIFSPHSDPKIQNEYVFRIVSVDGREATREQIDKHTDAWPRVVVSSGEHVFKVGIQHWPHRPHDPESQVDIKAEVRGGLSYILTGDESKPTLVEVKDKHP